MEAAPSPCGSVPARAPASSPASPPSWGDAVDPPFPEHSFDGVVSRSLLWTLRDPARAFRSWWRLVRPGGRVVAIYGLAPTSAPRDDGPYTPQTRAQLPASHLTDHHFVVQTATAAGFRDVITIPMQTLRGWETSPGSDLPHALVGYRPPAL